ncbi:hypothetical protein BYT27DRAFT_7127192 [Phlegmacium glaucopus]|nr:hypothetical protein BYT27DRAFT_7127192 [Phlegmacium glaucopus]
MSASSSSSWLTGIPVHSRPLNWPSNDETIRAGAWDREGTSLLNGHILHWLSFTRYNPNRTVTYLADTRSRGSRSEEPIVLSPIAKELDYAADRIALVGSDEFVSAEWATSTRTLDLRLHSLDGSLVRKDSISVQAAYGDLRVFGRKICICVSSGPTNAAQGAMKPNHLRLGNDTDDAESADNGSPNQILEWDLTRTSDAFRRINIPNPVCHGAEYAYPSEGQVAVAGLVDDQDGQEQLTLTCFNIDSDDQPNNRSAPCSFSPGGTSHERMIKGMGVGIEGSIESSDVIVHSFDRMAVFSRAFFNTEIPDNPRTGRLHYTRSLLLNHEVRILPFALPSSQLPAISNNRVLAYQKVSGKYRFHNLDFDQQRVNNLLNNTPEERESLQAELRSVDARVKVITRQFYAQEEGVSIGGNSCIDAEYPIRSVPPEWREHLRVLANEEKESKGGVSLLYDEAPEGRREGRWGYVQSELRLGRDVPFAGVGRMGVTTGCVVLVPEPGDSGVVWYFE